jgi:hypothetical protein
MQTVLLIFIVLFALAIGFFLGIFLISLDTPLTKSLVKKETSTTDISSSGSLDPVPAEIKKPTPNSRLILKIWREEGNPPVYEQDGVFFEKEQLPRELLNVITVAKEIPIEPETAPPIVVDEPPSTIDIPDVEVEIGDEDEEEVKMLSVVDEVNDILQKKITGSPLAGKGIHLMENHNNEIRFWVGLNSYDDVEDIPDEEVREIINAAVKEWERNRK